MTSRKTKVKSDGKPELGDGYLKIANELYDALCGIRIPGESRQVFDFILRRSYGYKKSEVAIRLTEFAQATGIKRQNVNRALQKLLKMRLIKVSRNPNRFHDIGRYSINKYYREWTRESKEIHESKAIPQGIQSDSTTVIQSDSTVPKDKVLKDNLKITTLSFENTKRLNEYFAKLEREKKLAPLKSVYDHWNHQAIIIHKKLTEKIKQKIRTHLKDNTVQGINQAINNYSTVLKGNDYFFHFKWPLIDFLDRGLRKFLNEAHPLENYQTPEAKKRQQAAPRTPTPRPEFPKQLTCKFCNQVSAVLNPAYKCPRCNESFYILLKPNGTRTLNKPTEEDLVTCSKCSYSWSYKACYTRTCPNCGRNNRKNGQTEPDVQNKKDGIFAYDFTHSDRLIESAKEEAKEIEALSNTLLKDVPPLTQSQKEALDEPG